MTDEITVEEVTSEVTADKGVTRRRKLVVTEITDSVTQAEPEVYMSAQTRAEMAYGAETLKKNAVNSAAE